MTLVLIGKDLVLEGSTTKIEDKEVPGIYLIYLPTAFQSPRYWVGGRSKIYKIVEELETTSASKQR